MSPYSIELVPFIVTLVSAFVVPIKVRGLSGVYETQKAIIKFDSIEIMDTDWQTQVEIIPYSLSDGIRKIERINRINLALGRFQEQELEFELDDGRTLGTVTFLDLIGAAGFVLKTGSFVCTAKWKLMPPGLRSGRTPANNPAVILGPAKAREAWNSFKKNRISCVYYFQFSVNHTVWQMTSLIDTTTPHSCVLYSERTLEVGRMGFSVGKKLMVTDNDLFWGVFARQTINWPDKNGKERHFQMSHIVKYLLQRETVGTCAFASSYMQDEIDLSHICHHPGCFNPDHLIFEPHFVNKPDCEMCYNCGTCDGHTDDCTGKVLPNCLLLPDEIN